MGHYANKCPQKKSERAEAFANATTWNKEQEANMFLSVQWGDDVESEYWYVVNNVVNVTQGLAPTEVLSDNAADTNVIHPMLLEDAREAERKIRVKGVGGVCS
jgi:hypothetical protein